MKTTTLIFLALFFVPFTAEARQYVTRINGREHVVHTRVAPVVVHRVFPPYKGIHIYEGRRVNR